MNAKKNVYLLLLILPPGSFGCSSPVDSIDRADTAEPVADLIDVELQLNWYPEAEHGGYYAALVHGEYEREGLRVAIKPGGPSVPVLAQVATGRVTFGVSNAHQILLGRAQDAQTVALMAPLQQCPRCIMVHEQSGIRSFEGLRDMTLAVNSSSTFALYMRKKVALPGVRFVPYSGSISHFLQSEDFAQQAYVFSEPFVARKQGAKPYSLMVSDLGFNPYTSVLIAHPDTVANRPDLVQRMVAATVRGWQKYLEDPELTNQRIHESNPDMNRDVLAYGAQSLRPLCVTQEVPLEQLGQMRLERWQELTEQLVEVDALKAGRVDCQSVFTSRFLEASIAAE